MSEGISDVVAGSLFQQLRIGVLSNNLANINTVGFKKDQVVYKSLAEKETIDTQAEEANISPDMANSAANIPAKTITIFDQGHVVRTGNNLDLALNGEGFFTIETPEGTQYTRKGNFTLNDQNELCTMKGLPVMGEGGRITLKGSDINIDEEGNVFEEDSLIDTLDIVNFEKDSLLKIGEGRFVLRDENIAKIEPENLFVQQGYVEQSNVNAVKMMTEMIDTLRGFESYQKVINVLSEVSSLAINKVGDVS